MAFEEALFNMYDPRLKPRLLHSIMMSHLPDEKQLPRSPAQLSLAVAAIRRHHLLSESPSSGSMGVNKSGDPRKGAVDAWADHLVGLLCSAVAENRWAGLCLLGVMCQECSRQRFLEFYTSWFQKLLLPLKQSTDPVFIRAAACASLTDLLTRLGSLVECSGVRRDGSALIAKLVQPILQILGDKDSGGIWNEAIDLLSAVLRYFPACLRQQSNNLESLLVARLMDADSPTLSQKCALCLALLPKAHGDAAMWSSMIRRVLIAINTELEYAFTGMEDVSSADDALASLLPIGQDPPWPLGGPSVAANAAAQAAKGFWQQLVPRVGSLLQCCQYLLTNPYPVPVPVPIGPLLALAMRILRVDGSRLVIPPPLGGAVSSVHQVSLCSEIPALHLGALDLLTAVLCGVRELLSHCGDIVRLVSDYFRRCGAVAPVLRVKLYDFARHLFVAMGAGGALLPDRWRAEVDSVLANVAMGAASGTICASLILDEDSACMEGSSSSTAFQVAAYRALLASLLSPCCHRPPYLAQGLAIFRKGRQEAGSEVAEVSAHALLALEPLIHPRCLPPAGAISAGLATGRVASTGTLVPHLQRPGKPMTGPGTIAAVPTAATSMNFVGPMVPPALKLGQLAMDPWAEVDTWLGYGEDFGEEDGLFYEDDNMLVDEFNAELDSSVGATGGGYYGAKQQNTNGHISPVVEKNVRDGDNFVTPLEGTKIPAFPGDDSHLRSEGHGGELGPQPTLEKGTCLGDSFRDQAAELPSTLSIPSLPSPVETVRDDCSPNKQEILFNSQIQSSTYCKEGSLVNNTSNTDVVVGEMNVGDTKEAGGNYLDNGRAILASTFPSVSGPKTPAMGAFSFSNPSVEIGSESDSDGVLPDIIDGDPDSD